MGVDVSIEAVSYPETLLTAASLVHPGAPSPTSACTASRSRCRCRTTLLKMVASGRIPAEKMGTHSFTFAQMDGACDVFKNAAENSALKVVITPA